ncbi:hypothetical protein SAMN05660226_03210 [Parapedobacter luteus]|uniref:Uncharacterized protein n=1 Tax=Parapedobacter luteus TaxID=623280 RepID=A0A1T5EA74_9SPHI|nr:hypothetical protein [Parapedobacter luteus]SKB80972.1 hypothetical protein SAMN05660226_03210 [Parapedobacter luteus]
MFDFDGTKLGQCTGRRNIQKALPIVHFSLTQTFYYSSKLIADQTPKGRHAAWNYAINAVYVIVVMDGFSMPGGNLPVTHPSNYPPDWPLLPGWLAN